MKRKHNCFVFKMHFKTFQNYFAYNGQDVKYPSISISKDEYNILKKTGKCDSINIVRTRRGMIWKKYDRIKYESENINQYSV